MHAAFRKAAHYFGVEAVVVPVGADFRADAAAMAAAIDDRTVLVVASAPSYAHGVVDPVPAIAAAAAARGVRCHVDACIGGWVLPYAARLGRAVPPWTFAVDGRHLDLGRHPQVRLRPEGHLAAAAPDARRTGGRSTSRSADWPGYTMLNSTMQSTKSGGPLAGAWAVVQSLGDDGYLALARDVFEAVDRIVAGRRRSAGLAWSPPPDSTLVALATDGSCDAFTRVRRDGGARVVRPAADVVRRPAADGPPVGERRRRSRTSTSSWPRWRRRWRPPVAAGPVAVDPGVMAFIEALDPATLSEDDFDGLLAASGLVGGGSASRRAARCPTRMAEVNAMLDLASPAMREALLVAFLDRLQRPVRG